MPRTPRISTPDVLFHVTARAPKGLMLFYADADRRHYLDLLGAEILERDWTLRSYCLMGNHLHLLLKTSEPDISDGMKVTHETYVRHLHRSRAGYGHAFGERFDNRPVLTDSYLLACLRYIARNPVAAGLCARAEDWPWSAHRALAGLTSPPAYLDVSSTREVLGITGYRSMVDTTDSQLLEALARTHPTDWMVHAVDEHAIPVPLIAAHLGVHLATAYRRLSTQRESGDSPLIRSGANEGTVPSFA